jgi:hypothetical protein
VVIHIHPNLVLKHLADLIGQDLIEVVTVQLADDAGPDVPRELIGSTEDEAGADEVVDVAITHGKTTHGALLSASATDPTDAQLFTQGRAVAIRRRLSDQAGDPL